MDKFIVTLRLHNGCIRFVDGDMTATPRKEYATQFNSEDKALQAAERILRHPDVKDAWTTKV